MLCLGRCFSRRPSARALEALGRLLRFLGGGIVAGPGPQAFLRGIDVVELGLERLGGRMPDFAVSPENVAHGPEYGQGARG